MIKTLPYIIYINIFYHHLCTNIYALAAFG